MVSWTSRSTYGLPRRTLPTLTSAVSTHCVAILSVAGIKHVAGGKKGHRTVVSRQDALNNLNAQAQLVDTAYVFRQTPEFRQRTTRRARGTILNDL